MAAKRVETILSTASPSRSERRKAARLDRILAHRSSRDALMTLTDDVLRIGNPTHALRRLAELAGGDLEGFGWIDRSALRLGGLASGIAPTMTHAAIKHVIDARIVSETKGVILPAGPAQLGPALKELTDTGFATNINLLGESILGDQEAARRLSEVEQVLLRPDTGYVSVKISALCANLDVLAFDESVDRIATALRVLYQTALRREPVGFVNLDMEEYRDLALTIAAFTRVLDEPAFQNLEAGIVLQAYLPDSVNALENLTRWATARRDRGGAGIKIRLVKGANLAMEHVEAELHGWVSAPYASKVEVDANLKRLLERALDPALDGAIRIGLGSHNLFDVSWAADLAERLGQRHRLEFEMLAGMAPAQARSVNAHIGNVRVYAPVVEPKAMDAAISYLARRLDENAAPQNFLRNLLRIKPGSTTFTAELERFADAVARRNDVSTTARRTQDRSTSRSADQTQTSGEGCSFSNTPDTDFTSPQNRDWIKRHLDHVVEPRFEMTLSEEAIDMVVSRARTAMGAPKGTAGWADPAQRKAALFALAELMERERGETLALMAHSAAKTIREGDPEVSEAIDAIRYAATVGLATLATLENDGLTLSPAGPVVIAAPWNFPYAIPSLALGSAVAAGCSVMVKPAPETRAVGAHLVAQCLRAGFPPDAVQLVVCEDGPVGTRLVSHPDVARVILTGASSTAETFLASDPNMQLMAETSGKNAMVITDAADLDQAIAALIRSAFGHAGQKCSAASLAILVGEVADNSSFLTRLGDAVGSLRVGPSEDLHTIVGPLISAPTGNLRRALTSLEPGEQWLVEPTCLSDDETLWSPGVRTGVRPGSWFHTTECFGPVLGIISAPDLTTATAIQNATGYGLTGGLQSLDPTEIEQWLGQVEVGNAYVNRQMTGAIVGRQPFGGWKQSSVGGSAKPGGPDHILMFVQITSPHAVPPSPTIDSDEHGFQNSYNDAWASLYGIDTDPTALTCEHNVLRHVSLRGVLVWHQPGEDRLPVLRAASQLTGTQMLAVSDAGQAADLLRSGRFERLRLLADCPDHLLRAAHTAGVAIDRTPITGHGRVELGRWLREQSISVTAHRHGRILSSMRAPLSQSRSISS